MGTKQLQADRRVASVELNEAGKAAKLTLAPGWTFEGSSGPFDLKNVEHGHAIVRGAQGDASVASTTRRPKATTPSGPRPQGVDPSPQVRSPDTPAPRPTAPRGDEVFVYRVKLVKNDGTEEICAWIHLSHQDDGKKKMEERIWALLRDRVKGREDQFTPEYFRWTNKHQAEARKEGTTGSPWGGENHG